MRLTKNSRASSSLDNHFAQRLERYFLCTVFVASITVICWDGSLHRSNSTSSEAEAFFLTGFVRKEINININVNNAPSNNDEHSSTNDSSNEDNNDIAMEPFCVPWEENYDEWWTHHPEWEIGVENKTHYCFQGIEHAEKRRLMVELYQTQFKGNCSLTVTKKYWNSGWNADFLNVIDGLQHALLNDKPFQLENAPWHYADPERAKPDVDFYKDIRPVCPQGNMQCYFLPLSNCAPAQLLNDHQRHRQGLVQPPDQETALLEESQVGSNGYQWLYEYATRKQTWLRKLVHEFATERQSRIVGPCTAVHVRRSDVVLHPGELKRQYHPIRDYINASHHVQHNNIFLMTDDENAITEATTEFPDYNWMYIRRTRFRADAGGFEVALPSKDPLMEVVVILSTFQLVRKCTQLIHSYSTFAIQLWAEIKVGAAENNQLDSLSRIQIDKGQTVFSADHDQSVSVSTSYAKDTAPVDSLSNEAPPLQQSNNVQALPAVLSE